MEMRLVATYMKQRLLISILFVFVLVSCGPAATNIPESTTAVPTITQSPTVAPTDTPVPTDTPEPTATNTPLPTATSTPVAYGPDNFPENVNPLTGLQVDDPDILDRRPLGIKINIYPRRTYRPAFGLNFADIVYEYYHNDGVSRLHAIYYGEEAEMVGPIRSGRLLDDMLVRMFGSIFVYGGADPIIDQRFWGSDYASRIIRGGFDNAACPPTQANPLCTFEPNGRHNLVGSTELIRAFAENKKIDNTPQILNGMSFHGNVPGGGDPGEQAYIRYSADMYGRWDYDEKTGRYLLFRDTLMAQDSKEEDYEPMIDRVDNEQVGAENVVILLVPDQYAQRPPAEIVEIFLLGSGKGYALRDGQIYEVTWNHPTRESLLTLTFPDGSSYPFKPGQTWFEVLNLESKVTEEDGSWRFVYNIRP